MAGGGIFTTNEYDSWQTNTVSFVNKPDLLDDEGKIKIEMIPEGTGIGTQITVSPTPPPDPQPGDIWIDTSE
jgi:hypothetical protein